PIPGDHQDGYEESRDKVDLHAVTVLRALLGFSAYPGQLDHRHVRLLSLVAPRRWVALISYKQNICLLFGDQAVSARSADGMRSAAKLATLSPTLPAHRKGCAACTLGLILLRIHP